MVEYDGWEESQTQNKEVQVRIPGEVFNAVFYSPYSQGVHKSRKTGRVARVYYQSLFQ